MRISIVIPVLNEAERIGPLVRYLQSNGGSLVLEILVADAGSTDETVLNATEAGAKIVQCPVRGRAAQMNAGARAAQGEILYFIHADTIPPDTFAFDIQSVIKAGYEMGCYRYVFDINHLMLKINAYFTRFHWIWCQGGDKTFFIRKSVFDQLGGYNEYYSIMEEYDFLLRARKGNLPFYIIPKNAIVSARKYRKNGWLRVQLANLVAFNLFRWGAQPGRVKGVYQWMLK
ncbi:MAG: TIGR04283 family arsenosugar biosynthesis glycosyltransferase [Bacteroidota bacterium]